MLENLTPDQKDLLDKKVEIQSRFAAITFKVMKQDDREIILQVKQDQSFHQNQFDDKRLREITHETFDEFLQPGQKLHVSIKAKQTAPCDVVTAAWIQQKQLDLGIKNKDIVRDTGIDKTTVSAYVGGLKPLSGVVKALFYYYFTAKELQS